MPRYLYTPREYTDMHYIYGECRGNAHLAAQLYRERYPDRRHPDHRVIARVHITFGEGRFPGQGKVKGLYFLLLFETIKNYILLFC